MGKEGSTDGRPEKSAESGGTRGEVPAGEAAAYIAMRAQPVREGSSGGRPSISRPRVT
jgi:hypothetical protein